MTLGQFILLHALSPLLKFRPAEQQADRLCDPAPRVEARKLTFLLVEQCRKLVADGILLSFNLTGHEILRIGQAPR